MKVGNRFINLICLMFLMCCSLFAQSYKSATLPESEAENISNQCSRPNPPKFTKTWKPTDADTKAMEAKFSDLKKLKVEECCSLNFKVEHPENFHLQYVGIVIKGKKFIYINAFAGSEPPKWWKEKADMVCDGGRGFWGVLYNTETGKFSDLAVNGVA